MPSKLIWVNMLLRYRWVLLVLLVSLSGCEKEITLNAPQNQPLLVVDAEIENGVAPVIVLSTSLSYFSSIDTAQLFQSLVKDAVVSISSGNRFFPMVFRQVVLPNGARLGFYSNDPASPSPLLGAIGTTYTLNIQYKGQTYNATTTIPAVLKPIDSLWSRTVPNRPASDSFRILMGRFVDPPGLGNYVRYFTRVNRQDFLPGSNSAFDDNIIDGTTYSVAIDRGVNRNFPATDRDNASFFKIGDTVTLKYTTIDKGTYDFWRTWEFAFQSIGNPFSSPGVVLGNVSNGALGAFCGYGARYRTLIIPR